MNNNCNICLGNLCLEENTKTICNCIYHKDCLERWNNINNTCPICNIEITPYKPIDVDIKFDIQRTYTREFCDKLIERYICKKIRSITLIFENFGKHIISIGFNERFNILLTQSFLEDLNKQCIEMRKVFK